MNRVVIPNNLSVITYSTSNKADITLKGIRHQDLDGTDILVDLAGRTISTHVPLPGMHNVSNALAAAACGVALGIEPEKIARGIMDARFPGMRSEIIISDKITIINDCYNANPASMKAALTMLVSSPHIYKAAVLGDMLELGNDSDYWHDQLGTWVAHSGIHRLIVTGAMAKVVSNAAMAAGMDASAVHIAHNMDDIFTSVSDIVHQDAIVLVKASRALHLDLVVNHLKGGGLKYALQSPLPSAYIFLDLQRVQVTSTFRTIYATITALIICFCPRPVVHQKTCATQTQGADKRLYP